MKILSDVAKFIYDELKSNPENFYMDDQYYLRSKTYKNINLWIISGCTFLRIYYLNHNDCKYNLNILEKIILWQAIKKPLKLARKEVENKILEELRQI